MTPTESVRTCLQKYATFEGRAKRPEYWWFILFNVIGSMVVSALDTAVFDAGDIGILGSLWGIALLLPWLAVGARRLHDREMSGWWLLLYLIPVIGWIALLVLFALKGTEGSNRFGPEPSS